MMPLYTVKPRQYIHTLTVIGSFIVGMCVKEPLMAGWQALRTPPATTHKRSRNITCSIKKTVIPCRKNIAHVLTQADALFQDIETGIHNLLRYKTAQCLHAKKLRSRQYKPLATMYSSYVLQKNLT